jgi:hypothetical protein
MMSNEDTIAESLGSFAPAELIAENIMRQLFEAQSEVDIRFCYQLTLSLELCWQKFVRSSSDGSFFGQMLLNPHS